MSITANIFRTNKSSTCLYLLRCGLGPPKTTQHARPGEVWLVQAGCFVVLSTCFKAKRKEKVPALANPRSSEGSQSKTLIEASRSMPHAPAPTASSPLPGCSSDLNVSQARVENGDLAGVQEDDLRQEAFEGMDEATKRLIGDDFHQSGDKGPIENLINIVRNHATGFEGSPTRIRAGNRTIIWRDCAGRVVDGLTILGNIAVQFAPSPSSIIWSALKVLLKTHVDECESLVAMLGCATEVLPLVRTGAVYEKVHLRDLSNDRHESTVILRDALINLYGNILQLLTRAKKDLGNRSAMRFLNALLNPVAGDELMQELKEAERRPDSAVQVFHAEKTEQINLQSAGYRVARDTVRQGAP